ncbi:MAG: hypothetical protein COA69_12980 [Robiginitomaculum sp.]|nr:MAG: hypothetical protein COA69_12980 [Robiginitomaculum sp.]
MSKVQTFFSITLGVLASILLSAVLIFVLPVEQGERFLAASFVFPIFCAFLTVLMVRGFPFSKMAKLYAGLIVISLILIKLNAPL